MLEQACGVSPPPPRPGNRSPGMACHPPCAVYIDPIVSRKLQVLLESGLNILLDGPQGCGKTVLARAIAGSLGMEFVFFNCAAVLDATDKPTSSQKCSRAPSVDDFRDDGTTWLRMQALFGP